MLYDVGDVTDTQLWRETYKNWIYSDAGHSFQMQNREQNPGWLAVGFAWAKLAWGTIKVIRLQRTGT